MYPRSRGFRSRVKGRRRAGRFFSNRAVSGPEYTSPTPLFAYRRNDVVRAELIARSEACGLGHSTASLRSRCYLVLMRKRFQTAVTHAVLVVSLTVALASV